MPFKVIQGQRCRYQSKARMRFYFLLLYSNNRLLLDLFWLYYGDCYSADNCLHHVFGPRHAAVSAVYEQFSADCLT